MTDTHIGDTKPIANHNHDMVHELSKRIDGVWRYDQYIANADGHDDLKAFWQEVKEQDLENVRKLKQFVRDHSAKDWL